MLKLRKFLHIGISVYILALLTVPCNDVCDNTGELQPAVLRKALTHRGMESDLCTPFCSCSCCACPFMSETPVQITLFHFSVPFNSHYASTTSDYLFKIWLPPKAA